MNFKQMSAAQKGKLAGRVMAGMFFISLFTLIIYGYIDEPNRRKAERLEKQNASKETKIKRAFSSWDGSHKELTEIVKLTMKNPSSYEHVRTQYTEYGTYLIVYTTYTGTNSFGATVTETIKAKTDIENGTVIEILSN